ncbi:MAG TPA: hypothetical protein VIJ14_05350, partial [Rhabdochlamydiaceae bacterium]
RKPVILGEIMDSDDDDDDDDDKGQDDDDGNDGGGEGDKDKDENDGDDQGGDQGGNGIGESDAAGDHNAEPQNDQPESSQGRQEGPYAMVLYQHSLSPEQWDTHLFDDFDQFLEDIRDEENVEIEEERVDEEDVAVDEIVFIQDESNKREYISSTGAQVNEDIFEAATDTDDTEDVGSSKADWFNPIPQSQKSKSYYSTKTVCIGSIMSWKYDESLDLFVIKRSDGLQYFKRSFQALSSLSKWEIGRLSKLNLINRSNNNWADQVQRVLRNEVRGSFDLFKPTMGKRKIYKNRIDPLTKRPWVKLVYPPIDTLKKIPLNTYPQDSLTNFKRWWYDGVTGEAVLEDEIKGELVRVFDPISLINFSASDLRILHSNKILFDKECKTYAMQFQKVVNCCIQKGIQAGSLLPANWAD